MIIKQVAAACGEKKDGAFLFPVRVYYEDTDAGGIVYYANYLKFAERARTEHLRALGVRQQEGLQENEKFGFVVRHCEIDYKAPAMLDDELIVSCRVTEASGAAAEITQEVLRGDQVLAAIQVKVVYVSLATKRPVRIPKDLLEKMI